MKELSDTVVNQLTDAIYPFEAANTDESVFTSIGLETGVVAEVCVSVVTMKTKPKDFDYDGLHSIEILIEGDNCDEWVEPLATFLREELDLSEKPYDGSAFPELGDVQVISQSEDTYPSVSVLIPSEDLYGDVSETYELTFLSGKTAKVIVPNTYGERGEIDEEKTIKQGIQMFWWDSLDAKTKLSYLQPDGFGPMNWVDNVEQVDE